MKYFGSIQFKFLLLAGACISFQMNQVGSASPKSTPQLKNLSVSLNLAGTAKTIHRDIIAKAKNHTDEPPFMNGEPEHVRLTFDQDHLSNYTTYLERQLLVYPVTPYAALFQGKEKAAFEKGLSQLKNIIATKSDGNLKELPILPAADASEVFHNQLKHLKFKQGSGVAFLSCYAQEEAPIKNGDLFYTFQGLTNDGKYCVSFFCPVKVKNLPLNPSPKETAKYLSKAPRTQFSPNLDTLDSMIQSLSVKQ